MTLAEQYVYEVYKNRSFSLAAKKLFISQPALSSTIARLEKELGFRIFDRSVSPLELTPEGNIYIETLTEIEETRRVMKERIKHLAQEPTYDVFVGGTTFVAQTILPFLCGEHLKRYPQTHFSVDMSIYIGPMLEKLSAHSIDLVIGYEYDQNKYSAITLFEEQRVIVVPKAMVQSDKLLPYALTREEILCRTYGEDCKIEDLSLLEDIAFLPHRSDNCTSHFMASFMQTARPARHAIPTIPSLTSNYYMTCMGMGAAITTETIIAGMKAPTEDMLFFVPKTPDARAKVFLLHAIDKTLSPAASAFAQTATEACQNAKILSVFL